MTSKWHVLLGCPYLSGDVREATSLLQGQEIRGDLQDTLLQSSNLQVHQTIHRLQSRYQKAVVYPRKVCALVLICRGHPAGFFLRTREPHFSVSLEVYNTGFHQYTLKAFPGTLTSEKSSFPRQYAQQAFCNPDNCHLRLPCLSRNVHPVCSTTLNIAFFLFHPFPITSAASIVRSLSVLYL